MHTIFWLENFEGRCNSEYLGVDGKIISEWTLRKEVGEMWTGFIWLRQRRQ
jgi:hypothetical protein